MSQSDDKTWGVGVELSADHMGPLRFAAVLARGGDRVLGIHVMPDRERLHPLISREQAKQIHAQVERNVATMLEQGGVARDRIDVLVLEDDYPGPTLLERAAMLELDALLVGRRARRDEDPIVRLGEVTRRVVRKLPAPVIVVPPDFGDDPRDLLGAGPIILATDLSDHCIAAARFAKLMAARLERPLLLAHGTTAFHWGVSYMPTEALDQLLERSRSEAGKALAEWAAAQGLADAAQHVFMGDPARSLVHLAYDHDAALVVTGSRGLAAIERIFLASVSSELAAATRCPTAVVPG